MRCVSKLNGGAVFRKRVPVKGHRIKARAAVAGFLARNYYAPVFEVVKLQFFLSFLFCFHIGLQLVAVVFPFEVVLVAQLAKEFLVYPVKADFVQLNLFERVNTPALVAFDFGWVHWNWWLVWSVSRITRLALAGVV